MEFQCNMNYSINGEEGFTYLSSTEEEYRFFKLRPMTIAGEKKSLINFLKNLFNKKPQKTITEYCIIQRKNLEDVDENKIKCKNASRFYDEFGACFAGINLPKEIN